MTTSYPYQVVECDRRKKEKKVIASQDIMEGEIIMTRPWLESVSFIITDEKEAATYGSSVTFNPESSTAIDNARTCATISSLFTQFATPAHLQMTCAIIRGHSFIAQQWVKEGSLVRRQSPNIAPMDADRHRISMQWLKKQEVPVKDLLFWAIRDNFAALYEIVVGNALTFDYLLSGTTAGLSFCPILAAFNHSCLPNVVVKHMPNHYIMVAMQDIKAGDEICHSYINEAIGLVNLEEIQLYIRSRFGFWCDCDLHTGKASIFQDSVLEPKSSTALTHRNKHLRVLLTEMEHAARDNNWEQVRKIGAQVWKNHSELVSNEPRLAFAFAKHYVQCVQYSDPDKYGAKWVALYERILEQYCANPFFTIRAYFWTMLETVRRWSTSVYNEDTKQKEQVFRGCQGEDLTLFLNRWMEIRRYLRHCFGDPNDIVIMESHLYSGLYRYMHLMESTVDQVEDHLNTPNRRTRSPNDTCKNLTKCLLAQVLTITTDKISLKKVYLADTNGDLPPSPQELDKWIRESNPKHYPADAQTLEKEQEEKRKLKQKNKKLRQRQRKKESRKKVLIDQDQEDDEEDDFFIPIQFDFDDDMTFAPTQILGY